MSWRQSFVFARETEYGKGHDPEEMLGYWYQPPPASSFKYTYSRDGRNLTQVGQRTWKEVAYGKVSGSWQWTFPLDYDYLEPFLFVYDTYSFATNETTLGYHSFSRSEEGITPSFCVRVKTLHRAVGGQGDQFDDLYGCMVTAMKLSVSAGNSQIMVSLNGVFTDMVTGVEGAPTGVLGALDYTHRPNNAVRFACFYIGDEAIADVLSVSVQSKTNISTVHSILNPVARSRCDKGSSYLFSCTIFSKTPAVLRQRVYTGGYSADRATNRTGLAPIPQVSLISEDGDNKMTVVVEDVVVRSMGFNEEDGLLVDTLDSVDCRNVSLAIRNNIPYQYDLSRNALGEYNTDPQGNPRPIIEESGQNMVTINIEGHLTLSETYTTEG